MPAPAPMDWHGLPHTSVKALRDDTRVSNHGPRSSLDDFSPRSRDERTPQKHSPNGWLAFFRGWAGTADHGGAAVSGTNGAAEAIRVHAERRRKQLRRTGRCTLREGKGYPGPAHRYVHG